MTHALIPLSDWLRLAPDAPIATGDMGAVSRDELLSRVAHWCQVLPARPGQRWAVYHQDTVEFLSLLLALWQQRCTVCVPGDDRPATTKRLQRRVDGFAGQYPASLATYQHQSHAPSSQPEWQALPADFPALEIFTSGSTGEPKPVVKTFAQIESELAALEQLWPGQHDAVIVTTVSHQHLYGLTFRLFWPLCRGQLFERDACQFTEDIYRRAQQHPQFSLVSTPSHLGRFNPSLEWHSLSSKCRGALSSAAPLQRQDSLQVSDLLGVPVREIYGSSETGAVAWRAQHHDAEARWALLPGISMQLNPDSTLTLRAAQIAGDGQTLSDQVALDPDGCFRLLGRTDRIAKVEGKRVSLAEVEQVAEQHPLIKSARALALSRKRVEIALVVQLNDEGLQCLGAQGKRGLVREIREAFKPHFEPVALPRRWRFVEQMPYNQQGKITMDALMALFHQDEAKWPELISRTSTAQTAALVLRIPAELIYFDGHFAGNPILPGITQVHWAVHYGRQLFGTDGDFGRLEVVKFQQVIFPESQVSLELEYSAEKNKLGFRYYSDKGVHSSGRICFS
ncbi:AMP-binding protein [Marinobacterium zhoushanense]|uniref:AMP-binding protein n=1 Tax=Marinobacterium zhoushanense TaxID=1679163 RepID=A0ABQ1K1N7_9GAMM|nr:AMP-binding protein [Marinobacterium zhoushanense]GGB81012.1 AMP-binding protein [Marinobacterium zhoushanense]